MTGGGGLGEVGDIPGAGLRGSYMKLTSCFIIATLVPVKVTWEELRDITTSVQVVMRADGRGWDADVMVAVGGEEGKEDDGLMVEEEEGEALLVETLSRVELIVCTLIPKTPVVSLSMDSTFSAASQAPSPTPLNNNFASPTEKLKSNILWGGGLV